MVCTVKYIFHMSIHTQIKLQKVQVSARVLLDFRF